jgi:hypothetical protein
MLFPPESLVSNRSFSSAAAAGDFGRTVSLFGIEYTYNVAVCCICFVYLIWKHPVQIGRSVGNRRHDMSGSAACRFSTTVQYVLAVRFDPIHSFNNNKCVDTILTTTVYSVPRSTVYAMADSIHDKKPGTSFIHYVLAG